MTQALAGTTILLSKAQQIVCNGGKVKHCSWPTGRYLQQINVHGLSIVLLFDKEKAIKVWKDEQWYHYNPMDWKKIIE